MVATVVRLKLTLLRHSLRRDPWRLVVLLLGILWALGTTPTLLAGAWWLAGPGTAARPDILVVAGTLLVLGWVVIPVLVFGTDDSLDPVRFATFAVPVRRLVPALGVASAISVPAVFAGVVCTLSLVAWAGKGATVTIVTALCAPVSWVTCLLSARVATLAATRVIATRGGRRLAAAAAVAVIGLVALGVWLIGSLGMSAALDAVPGLSTVLGWSPLAFTWAAPAAAATDDLAGAVARLVLAVVWVIGLVGVWHHLLRGVLTHPVLRGGPTRRRHDLILDRAPRNTSRVAAAAVAGRARRYWAGDGRYLSALAAGLLLPVMITGLVAIAARDAVIVLGPLLGATLGWGRHNDTAFDGSALWMHVTSGMRGVDDRRGRARGVMTWAVPVVVVGSVVGSAVAGRWAMLPASLGAGLGLLLVGLGVSAVASVVLPYPAPQAGASPFAAETGGIGASMAAQLVSSVVTTVLALPVLVGFALAWWWSPAAGWVTLALGVLGGGLLLRSAVDLGGRALDSRWAALLVRVS